MIAQLTRYVCIYPRCPVPEGTGSHTGFIVNYAIIKRFLYCFDYTVVLVFACVVLDIWSLEF